MNKLANSGLGRNASKELIIGGSEEVITALFDYFSQKGLNVTLVDEDEHLSSVEKYDIVLYQIDWEEESVYFSPFRADGYCPDVVISLNCLSTEKILDNIIGFLEAIKF